jgi:proline-specific peptidase
MGSGTSTKAAPAPSPPSPKEDYAPFPYDGAEYQTFYKVWGDLSDKTKTPVVIIHGGPGLSHDYMLALSDLSIGEKGVPVIMYDQLGNARSSRIKDKPKTFWTIDLFISELVNLLSHLDVQDAFDIYGHSWGGMLSSEFVIRCHPKGLRHLVIADSPTAMALWFQSLGQRIAAMPEDVQKKIAEGKKADPDGYRKAMFTLYAQYGCRTDPIRPELVKSMEYVMADDADTTVGDAMYVYPSSVFISLIDFCARAGSA